MAKRDFENTVLRIRRGTKQNALQQAVLVPWRRLQERASDYADWHIFLLWVRTIAEIEEPLPEIVRIALSVRCPGFLDDERQRQQHASEGTTVWRFLEEWIAIHRFADAKTEGWFDALMYYAYKDLRTEQAWTLWQRTRDDWRSSRPERWPTLDEWTAKVIAVDSLIQAGTEMSRVVEASLKVNPERLHRAVSALLESRAFAFWVACVSRSKQTLDDAVLKELSCRYPGFLARSCPERRWHASLFFRVARFGEAEWRATAHAEKWHTALRYHLIHHPRYHRLLHYHQRCNDEWLNNCPASYPSFAEWLCAADEYFVARAT
jgi:hypothetical protein